MRRRRSGHGDGAAADAAAADCCSGMGISSVDQWRDRKRKGKAFRDKRRRKEGSRRKADQPKKERAEDGEKVLSFDPKGKQRHLQQQMESVIIAWPPLNIKQIPNCLTHKREAQRRDREKGKERSYATI